MQRLLEIRESISTAFDDGIEYIKSAIDWLLYRYAYSLIIIAILSHAFFDSIFVPIACLSIFLAKKVGKLIDVKIAANRVQNFDPKTPELLSNIILDAINEFWIYHYSNQTGSKHYINSDQEVKMAHGVVDIVLSKLEESALNDKFELYYGKQFPTILSVKVSMHVTNFVIEVNNAPPFERKNKRAGVPLQEDMVKAISELGIDINKVN